MTRGATRTARAAGTSGAARGGRGDHPVVVAPEGRATGLRGPTGTTLTAGAAGLRATGLLREGRGSRGARLLERLGCPTATGAALTGTAGATATGAARAVRTTEATGAREAGTAGSTRGRSGGRGNRSRGVAAERGRAGARRVATERGETGLPGLPGLTRLPTAEPGGATRPTGTTRTAGTTRPTGARRTAGTTVAAGPGRAPGHARSARPTGTARSTAVATRSAARSARSTGARLGAVRGARRDGLGGAVHLRGARALVVVRVTAAVGGRGRLLEAERRVPTRALAGTAGAAGTRARPAGAGGGRRGARRGRGVRGRRVGQEVPPALLAEGRAALTGRAALRAELRLGGEVRRAAAGAPGTSRARRRRRGAGRRVSVAGARGRRWRRRGYGTGHTVTADLAPVVGTRLVSVRAGRHVGASPSPFRHSGRVLWPRRAGLAERVRIPGGGARLSRSGTTGSFRYFSATAVAAVRSTSLHEQSLWTWSRGSSRRPP